MGIRPAMVGFILSADGLAALIVQPLITPLVHIGNARRWLFGGSFLFSAALFMVGHISTVSLLVVARLLQGTGFICVLASLITMIVPCIPPGMSGRAFGYVSLVRLIPYAVIPLLFDLFAIAPSSFAIVLDVAALTALLPVVVLMVPLRPLAEAPDSASSPGMAGMAASLSSRPVLLLLTSALLFFCGYSAIFFYLKQFATSVGITSASLFFTIATLTMIGIRLLGGWLFDRYSKVFLCAAGLFTVAGCYGLLPLCHSSRMLFVLAVFSGLGWGIAMPLQAAAMFDISPSSVRAMNQNLLLVMMQGGFFLGPFLGGQLIARFGYTTLFIGLALSGIAAGFLMTAIKPPRPQKA
ncbi:MAG: MFS transporter [Desulfobulbus sp.]